MNPIRVVHCIQDVRSGGVERRRLSLVRSLDASLYKQILVCTTADSRLREEFEGLGCEVFQVGSFRMPLDPVCIGRAMRIFRQFSPHIVHGAVFEGVSMATVAGFLARVPIRIAEETSDPINRSARGRRLFRVLTAMADRTVAISPAVHRYLVEVIGVPKQRVVLINNGVEEPKSAEPMVVRKIRGRMGGEGAFVIGAVGRLLDDHKRFSDVIRALATVVRAAPETRLLIVGDGPDRVALSSLAGELGVQQYVYFAGYQRNPRAYMEATDVFVHVPVREGFGLVVVEAMFAEKPVIATRVGGIPYIVQDRVSGVLIDPCDPHQLSNEILSLRNDPIRRREMGQRGFQIAQASHGAERYVRDVDRLYQELVADRLRAS